MPNNINSINSILKMNEALWDVFTRSEEVSCEKTDRHGRFSYKFSNNKEICTPIVSRYLINSGFEVRWPDDKQFAICLTHDADRVHQPFIRRALNSAYFAKQGKIFHAMRQFMRHYETDFDLFMNLEERYGATSSIYFMAADKDVSGVPYNIEDIDTVLGEISDKGWEIGLHGGYYAYNDLNTIVHEKKRLEKTLGKKVIGYRNHYLRFSYPQTLALLENAGFVYDTTLGYSPVIGFRNGMCHPFHPYDPQINSTLNIVEIPMAIMDCSVFHMAQNFDEAWKLVKHMTDIVSDLHGVLCVNWHTDVFNRPNCVDWARIYEKILKYGYEKDAWMTSGENIIKEWS